MLIVSLSDTSNNHNSPLASFISHNGCALYSVTNKEGVLRCVAPNIFAELPKNSTDPAFSFDRDGNLLVIGRRFVTSHTDTCQQPTPSGCAAWEVEYQLEPSDQYARLFKIENGAALEIAPGEGDIALASYNPLFGETYLLSGTFYGYELETELRMLTANGVSPANLGKANSILASGNGLLFVDYNRVLQFSQTRSLTPLILPTKTLRSAQWFNPNPQKLTFDRQGQLYALFQERRQAVDGRWRDYLLTYRLLPYTGTPLGEIAVADTFFTTTLTKFSPIPLAGGFAFIDCNQNICQLFAQTPSVITGIPLPTEFISTRLSAHNGDIILDGRTSGGQLMQMIFTSSPDGALSEKSRTLFPLNISSVITLPAPATTTELRNLHINSMTLSANNLSLSFNQNLECMPAQVFIQHAA